MTSCATCQAEFVPYRSSSKYCSHSCRVNSPKKKANNRRYQQRARGWINDIKVEKGCVECGYNKHPAALDFNHRNPLEKSFNISRNTKKSWHLIEAEIAKCDVLCSNCHRIHTHENNHYRPKAGL